MAPTSLLPSWAALAKRPKSIRLRSLSGRSHFVPFPSLRGPISVASRGRPTKGEGKLGPSWSRLGALLEPLGVLLEPLGAGKLS